MYCFRYAMSGSLLGVELKGITSAPVGYLSIIRMYPMDFEEFMIANSVSNMTLDILIEMGGKVVAIEVKSGKSYKSHKALENYMEVPDYHIEGAYVLSTYNVEKDGRVIYLPIYMSYLLQEPKAEQLIVDLDMSGL